MLKENITEILALGMIIITIVGLPFALMSYHDYYINSHFPENAQVIDLTASAKQCVWTREPIVGYNYWWKKFKGAKEIPIYDDGSPIFFRVKSADVLHSFAIPFYRIGPYDIKGGEVVAVELKTNRRLKSTKYLCWQYCSVCHPYLNGRLIVQTPEE